MRTGLLKQKTPLKAGGGLKKTELAKVGKRGKRYARRDALARKACRERAEGLCERCGRPGTQTCHVIHRDEEEFRWLLENLYFGCDECHTGEDTPGGSERLWTWFKAARPDDYAVIGHRDKWTVRP